MGAAGDEGHSVVGRRTRPTATHRVSDGSITDCHSQLALPPVVNTAHNTAMAEKGQRCCMQNLAMWWTKT